MQSYEIKLPSQAFLDWRFLHLRKLREIGCHDVAKFRFVTIDSSALIQSCLLFTNPTCLNFSTEKISRILNPKIAWGFHSFERMHSNLAFTWEISGGTQFTVAPVGPAAAEAITKHTFGAKHGAVRESGWEVYYSGQNVLWMNYKSLGSECQVIICSNKY